MLPFIRARAPRFYRETRNACSRCLLLESERAKHFGNLRTEEILASNVDPRAGEKASRGSSTRNPTHRNAALSRSHPAKASTKHLRPAIRSERTAFCMGMISRLFLRSRRRTARISNRYVHNNLEEQRTGRCNRRGWILKEPREDEPVCCPG